MCPNMFRIVLEVLVPETFLVRARPDMQCPCCVDRHVQNVLELSEHKKRRYNCYMMVL